MDDILILNEADLRSAVALDRDAVDVVETAFRALAEREVVMPPVLSMPFRDAHGEVDIKTAYIPGFDSFAIKISPGFFNNASLGLPSLNGLMVVLSAKTGLVEAVLLDNGYLTNVRTAAAGAVAARHLAPEVVTCAGVIGTGVQARLQLQAAHLDRPFERAMIWGRSDAAAESCAQDLSDALGIDVSVAPDAETLVRRCQLVVTSTPSTSPVIKADWLHEGLHITAMGSDQAGKNELDPMILQRADRYVCDRVTQCALMGELATARAAGLMAGDPPELGQIVAGQIAGRTSADQITVCDLTGTGAQDTAIANFAIARLKASGKGTAFKR